MFTYFFNCWNKSRGALLEEFKWEFPSHSASPKPPLLPHCWRCILISLVIIDLPLHIKCCLGSIWFSGLESGLINRSARGSLWKWFALLLEIAWCRLTTRQGIICVENHPQGASIYSYPTLWAFPEITSELENLEARNPLFSMPFFFLISSSAHFLRCADYETGEMARRLRALGVGPGFCS